LAQSISFDRAADTYDETRALPEEIARKQTDAVVTELEAAGASRVLEIGIGTGRIARPLASRGVRVSGVDISTRMMARLREQIEPSFAPVDLLLGDATRLPIATASLRAVLIVHVLHLVSSWERALEELRRVLAPGGVFLHDRTRYGENNPWQRTFEKREELLANLGFVPRRRPSPEVIASKLEALGASLRTVEYHEDDETDVARNVLERMRTRTDSWTWEIPNEIFPAFFSQYEAYVLEELGSLEFEHTTHVTYGLEVWRFP